MLAAATAMTTSAIQSYWTVMLEQLHFVQSIIITDCFAVSFHGCRSFMSDHVGLADYLSGSVTDPKNWQWLHSFH